MKSEEAIEKFNAYLQTQNLKLTRQRSLITEVFFDQQQREVMKSQKDLNDTRASIVEAKAQ